MRVVCQGWCGVIETSFDSWFEKLAGSAVVPHNWQRSLANAQNVRSQLIRLPTGMGKSLGGPKALAWLEELLIKADRRAS